MHYLIWQIESRTTLLEQITRAAESFQTRTGLFATTLVVHPADRAHVEALGTLPQVVIESGGRTGTVSSGMFWIGVSAPAA